MACLVFSPVIKIGLPWLKGIQGDLRLFACRWDAGDVHEWSAISYPDKLLGYITQEFQKMKLRQAQLLGMGAGAPSKL